jgi:hypothetical protein
MSKHLITFTVALLGGFLGAALHQAPAAQAAVPEGLWVHGPDGRDRLSAATYTSGSERGLPVVAMYDNRSQLRLLLRLAGSNESPVIIFKDKSGHDRMVMGLGLNGGEEEPFLSTVDRQGHKTDVFGHY